MIDIVQRLKNVRNKRERRRSGERGRQWQVIA